MDNNQISKKQATAKLYNARSTIETMISMVQDDILTPPDAMAGAMARMNAIFANQPTGDNGQSTGDIPL